MASAAWPDGHGINLLARDDLEIDRRHEALGGRLFAGMIVKNLSDEAAVVRSRAWSIQGVRVSVGMGDGDDSQWRRALDVAVASGARHVNQPWFAAGHAMGALRSGERDILVNARISPVDADHGGWPSRRALSRSCGHGMPGSRTPSSSGSPASSSFRCAASRATTRTRPASRASTGPARPVPWSLGAAPPGASERTIPGRQHRRGHDRATPLRRPARTGRGDRPLRAGRDRDRPGGLVVQARPWAGPDRAAVVHCT